MPKKTTENLQKLENLVKRIIRKSLKNNTLDYTVQYSISSLEPSKIKYSAMISAPNKEIQDLTFSFESFDELKTALETTLENVSHTDITKTFFSSRINTYKSKIAQMEKYVELIDEKGVDANGFLIEDEESDEKKDEQINRN